ncbi:MAG: hypothetical protein GY830_01485 [Bacteroidetes bacterium]|nr:hypothetical protein [Bacteroidota bacterium]
MKTIVTINEKLIRLLMLPKEYLDRQAELKLLDKEVKKAKKKNIKFDAFEIDTTKFKFNREEAHER